MLKIVGELTLLMAKPLSIFLILGYFFLLPYFCFDAVKVSSFIANLLCFVGHWLHLGCPRCSVHAFYIWVEQFHNELNCSTSFFSTHSSMGGNALKKLNWKPIETSRPQIYNQKTNLNANTNLKFHNKQKTQTSKPQQQTQGRPSYFQAIISCLNLQSISLSMPTKNKMNKLGIVAKTSSWEHLNKKYNKNKKISKRASKRIWK